MFKQPLKLWQKEDITSTNVYIFAIQTDKTKKYIIMLNAIIKKIFFVKSNQNYRKIIQLACMNNQLLHKCIDELHLIDNNFRFIDIFFIRPPNDLQ